MPNHSMKLILNYLIILINNYLPYLDLNFEKISYLIY